MGRIQTVTVLFTDAVDSTEVATDWDGHGPDAMREHLDQMMWQVARHNGLVVKTLGDGVMATFASAVGALDCAVSMQRASSTVTAEGRVVHIRVGISSGDVELRDEDCFGHAVIEAARLCAHAEAGEILASSQTWGLTANYQPVRALGPVQLKGLPTPTEVYQAPWASGSEDKIRVVLADDAVLVREGIARLLTASGLEVVGQASDAEELEGMLRDLHPDLAVIDVHMPPTFTSEGLDIALRMSALAPRAAVIVLTQDPQPEHAERLISARARGVGYLLKERVTDVHDFVDAAQRVARGDVVIDESVQL